MMVRNYPSLADFVDIYGALADVEVVHGLPDPNVLQFPLHASIDTVVAPLPDPKFTVYWVPVL
jgi:hypothetical protein